MASAIEPNSSYYICYHKALAERYVYIYCQWWSLMHDLKNCILLVQAHNKAGSLGAWAPHFFKILKIKIRLIYLHVNQRPCVKIIFPMFFIKLKDCISYITYLWIFLSMFWSTLSFQVKLFIPSLFILVTVECNPILCCYSTA